MHDDGMTTSHINIILFFCFFEWLYPMIYPIEYAPIVGEFP